MWYARLKKVQEAQTNMDELTISTVAGRFNQTTGGNLSLDVNARVFALTGGEFNLIDMFRRVFGFRGIPYGTVNTNLNMVSAAGDADISTFSVKQANKLSIMGTPIFHPLTINGIDLPNEPLITLSGKNEIIRTRISGNTQRGSVKELIGEDDYVITVKGFAVNMDSDDYPEAEMRKLRQLKEFKGHMEVISPLLALFNINHVVLEDIQVPGVEGYQAIQGYELKLYSDDPYELEII